MLTLVTLWCIRNGFGIDVVDRMLAESDDTEYYLSGRGSLDNLYRACFPESAVGPSYYGVDGLKRTHV